VAKNFVFTSESVSDGHPDKVADQVSDAILDAYLKQDAGSRVACETLVKNNAVIVAGEVSSSARINAEEIVRKVIKDIGYIYPELGFDADTCTVISLLSEQSKDISAGVNEGEGLFKEQGAGDQGLMFGYACQETDVLMPLPIALSHKLMEEISSQRKLNPKTFLRPDAKSQVSVYYENNKPKEINTVVVSTQHSEEVSLKEVEEYVIENVVKKVIPSNLLTKNTRYLINPTGRFVIGGPVGDCGLTGRKIIVDTYGGYSRHGGGAFSGKDPSKVDRSAAYMARNVAKTIVATGVTESCEVQLAYAIGVAKPVAVYVDTFGTGQVDESILVKAINEVFDLTPKGIIKELDLLKPIFKPTAAFGHFGRQSTEAGHFSWEKTAKVNDIKKYL
jgi:S-adenosylmethionine synthetase